MAPSPSLIEKYQRILQADPRSRIFVELARQLLEARSPERAAEVCERGLVHHPTSVQGRVIWGKALLALGRPDEAISRLEQMIGMAGLPMTVASIRSQIANAIQLIVQLQRQSDGKRKVTSIAEVTGLEGDIIQMQEIFKFVRSGTAPDGTVQGYFQATGVRPRFLSHLTNLGITIPGSYFDPSKQL